ncbi:YhaN family protein [Candidatus Accumulibacter sp. ACC003]|uniref:YhaN family protein n=1 Tax=Candidatus Accumulibacter sp. ACC003 TaxID=2823334 RepID=UPI0025C4D6A4|nr:YhaN family protein [Candidatus Accumulibacter sp. ACC003]
MKIEQIDLKAYGHFTGQRLTLAAAANLHIICGPNEAGKTTLWRAINGALFGIPETSRDGHLHGNPNLRVGLDLSSRLGERLAVMRRKGRVNTLLKYDPESGAELSESVPEGVLRDWLGGLSQGLFLAMFSLDHDALVRGGAALAQGKGDAGESLFEAGAGLTSIRALRSKLDGEAETLFKPRASKSAIYRALADYDESRRQAKEAAVRPAAWSAARSAMDAARKDYETALAEQLRLQQEARRLERLAAILPDVAARELAQQQLAELASVPLLPPSAASERVAAVTRKTEALAAAQAATQRCQQHQAELAAIAINDAVLADAEAIEALHHATTAYREARLQAAKAEAAIETAHGDFAFVVRQIVGDEKPVEPLQWLPEPTRTARIRALITAGATLKARQQANLETQREKKLEVDQLGAEISSLGKADFSEDLASYLDSIADYGDPEARAQQLEDEASAAAAKLNNEARGLKMAAAEAIAGTTVPLDAEVQLFKAEDDELRRRARSIGEAIEKIENDLAALQGDIKGLQVRGDVPSREAVVGQRATRDALWMGFRRHFMATAGEPAAAAPAPAAERYERYEGAVSAADDAADGLFADAERATRYAEFRLREAQMQSGLSLERERQARIVSRQEDLDRRWAAVLATHRLPSLKIAEAAPWVGKREAFLQKFDASQGKRHEAEQRRQLAADIRSRLAGIYALLNRPAPATTERLSETLARARAVAKRQAEQLTQRQLKASQQANTDAALRHADAAAAASGGQLDEWQSRWADAMGSIRLAGDASAEEATARLQQLSDLTQAHAALEQSRNEQRQARIRIDDYEARLARTWQTVRGVELAVDGRSHDLLAAEIYRELTLTRARQDKKNTLSQQVADDQQAVEQARQAAAEATRIIDKLLLQAGCPTIERLELVEGQSAQATALAARIREIEARLVESAARPLAEALQQAAGRDPDAVAAALDRHAQENEENAADVQQRHAAYLSARQAFEEMDGSAAAADAQQKSAQHAARIAELGADYAASRIAAAVLAQVIADYQKRNQGPLIDKASKRFAAITGERYSGVVVDFDEEQQILKAVRADGERLRMEQLSTGRRDQLFLALRLAAIEGHLDNGEPLPVIIDDITIQFDDAAAAATFKVLADLSQRTQVLFLTHHEHLLEVAAAAIGAGAYQPHRLSS